MAVEKDPNYQDEYARAKAALHYRRTMRFYKVASGMNLTALKEPRGFIRCIEWILAIFAFATTTSHSSMSTFDVTCAGSSDPIKKEIPFSYPYRLYEVSFMVPFCNTTAQHSTGPYGNFASSAEFYVFVGVMAFLYTMASLALYIFFDEKYRKFENIPIADFIVTGVFSVLFLIASSAWAQGVTHLKYYSSPKELFIERIPDCAVDGNKCEVTSYGNFASLNVSLIFGFLNMAVWAANMWFLFKETKWFKRDALYQPSAEQQAPNQSWSTEESSYQNVAKH